MTRIPFLLAFLTTGSNLVAPLSVNAAAPTVFDDAVAAWHMADTRDAAGKDSRLTAEGAVTLGVELKGADRDASLRRGGDGKVAQFQGGYLSAGQGADGKLNLTGKAMTFCVRLCDPSGAWAGPIFSKYGGHENLVYNLFAGDFGGKILGVELGHESVQGMRQVRASIAEIGPAGWHDVVARYNGRAIELFVDGRLRDEYLAADPLRQGNTEPCLIGAESVEGRVKTGFRGMIDHVALWNRALTDSEIARLSGVERLQYPDVYEEKHRPQFHFSARRHWINDPNGLVFCKGEYHLYFQYMPPGRQGAWKDWGHAVSTDLVHWTQLPTALSPHKKWGGCWSGSAVVDAKNTSGFARGDEKAIVAAVTLGGTTQCIAYSLDRGRSFTMYDGNPVIGHIVGYNRDPKVIWHGPTRRWIMAFYLDHNDFALFASSDLKKWTRLSDVQVPGSSECPDFFELPVDGNPANTRWVFWAANGRFWLGTFDGREFRKEGDLLQADYGANFYAAQTFSDIPAVDGRRIQIAWMAGGRYPGMPFDQQLSFPCVLTLRTTPGGIRMCRQPVKEIELLREKEHHWENLVLKPGDNPLAAISGDLLEIQAEIEPDDATHVGFDIRGHKVQYDVKQRKLQALGRDAALAPDHGRIKLHLLVDRTSVEVFGNDGLLSMTSCFLPEAENKNLGIFSIGGTARIASLKVYPLRSAWPGVRRQLLYPSREGSAGRRE
jgi:sucrose-6-phosphate hydrolase SacC (GH32 family)